MIQSRWLRHLGLLAALAAVYFLAGKLGLRLAFVHPSATPVWPPAGIALAAFVLFGYGVWPAILFSAFLVNLTTAGSAATSIGIGIGNTAEGLLGAYLVNRFAHGRQACDRAPDVFKLTVLAGVVSTTVSATTGFTSLALSGFARWGDFGSIWLTWWLGDAVADVVVAPAVMLWSTNPRVLWNRRQALEAAALLVGIVIVGFAVFGGLFPSKTKNYPLEFLSVPLFVWAAFRFGPREAVTAVVVLSGIAIWGTLHGFGPFAEASPNESLLLLQAFIGVTAVMTLTLGAVVAERKDVEERLRQLAVSDPLTGLANYRQLADALSSEIRRSQRTDRPFAVVLLDLDGLKQINDRHGHLVGSMALRRVAETLLGSCRAVDTAARFGGDEFALVLPETGEAAAWRVAHRVAQRVAQDGEQPTLSISMGVAVYPEGGDTLEALLSAADRSLYESKAGRGRSRLQAR
jgi:diguanylate cyclase (GGDEF)-like protein